MVRQRSSPRRIPKERDDLLERAYVREMEALDGEPPTDVVGPPEYALLRELEPAVAQAAAVREALSAEDIETVRQAAPAVSLVLPGQVLARRCRTASETGDGRLPVRSAGDHVQVQDDALVSLTVGYAALQGSQVSVLPALWVAPDAAAAHLAVFDPATAPRLEPAWLAALLTTGGVTHGIDTEAVEAGAAGGLKAAGGYPVLARGQAPVDGVAGGVELTVSLVRRAGTVMEDGSIDLRERNAAVAIRAGEEVGCVVASRPGEPGYTVRGEELPAADCAAGALGIGSGVREELADDGSTRLVAEVDGVVAVADDKVSVNTVFAVSGDVDYQVGNIESGQDVQISGSVRPGFKVRAGGSVTIGGLVEAGAEVRAGGDVVAARGIVGENTKVVARGSVECRFVQNSTVVAGGNLLVGSFLYNGYVRVGGDVLVRSGGGERGGSIVGGQVFAGRRLEARRVGSGSTDRTVVGVRPKPELNAKIDRAREAVTYCETNALRILRTLGLEAPSARGIRQLLDRAAPGRRAQLTLLVRQLDELLKNKERAGEELQRATAEMDAVLGAARIVASEAVMPHVELRMGVYSRVMDDRLPRASLAWSVLGIVEIAPPPARGGAG